MYFSSDQRLLISTSSFVCMIFFTLVAEILVSSAYFPFPGISPLQILNFYHSLQSHQDHFPYSVEIIVIEKVPEAIVEVSVDRFLTGSQLGQETCRATSNTVSYLKRKNL